MQDFVFKYSEKTERSEVFLVPVPIEVYDVGLGVVDPTSGNVANAPRILQDLFSRRDPNIDRTEPTGQ